MEGAVKARSPLSAESLENVIKEIISLMATLLGPDAAGIASRVVRESPTGPSGVIGYISDQTLVFRVGQRAYLLGLGWSD
jgi:hypothetical protein